MPNLVHGQDPGGALRPIQVDDNGNLRIDLVSGISVSTEINSSVTLEVRQVSGSVDSVVVNSFGSSIEAKQVSGTIDSVSVVAQDFTFDVKQVSGSMDSVIVNSFGSSIEVKQVSGVENSVVVNSFLTSLEVKQVSGSSDSVSASIDAQTVSLQVSQVSGTSNSSAIQGLARQTNPTAVSDGAVVNSSFDDLGRQVITPYQVRDLVATAYLALSTGTEATLLAAGAAGVFHDLIYIMAANQSDAAVDIDFRDATAGGIVFSLTVPADATSGVAPAVPIPQNVAALPWTADMGDITGTTVNISALFIKNV